MILSYDRNPSILYAIAHGLCTWFYVLYRALWRQHKTAAGKPSRRCTYDEYLRGDLTRAVRDRA